MARSPKAIAAASNNTARPTSSRTSRSTRPSSRATRLTGVTRIRSITPERTSAITMKPTKAAPNRASCTSSPGM